MNAQNAKARTERHRDWQQEENTEAEARLYKTDSHSAFMWLEVEAKWQLFWYTEWYKMVF